MPPKAAAIGNPPRNPRTCPRNEIQHRVKKDAAGQVAVSVRIYEVLGYFAIIGPRMKDLDVTARTNERTPHYVQGRGREQQDANGSGKRNPDAHAGWPMTGHAPPVRVPSVKMTKRSRGQCPSHATKFVYLVADWACSICPLTGTRHCPHRASHLSEVPRVGQRATI